MNDLAQNLPPYKVIGIDSLVPYANNSRTHSPEQVDQIAASIREFGFTNPVLVDEKGTLIAGHGRLLAAHKLGITEVPSIELANLTEIQKKAYIIADNKLALNAGWDDEMLKLELANLADVGFDLELTGFGVDELNFVSDEPFPELSGDDREPYQQVAFKCHDEQAELIKDCISKAKSQGVIDIGRNENSNANAITGICISWMNDAS